MGLKLMIVDNDQVTSFVLKNIVRRNYSDAVVEMHLDGAEALEYLKEIDHADLEFPDVLLLDLYMPVLNGFDFLEAYTDLYSHKPTIIFAMSNSLSKEDQQKANRYNVVKGFITKPLIYNNIQFIVETYLQGKSQNL